MDKELEKLITQLHIFCIYADNIIDDKKTADKGKILVQEMLDYLYELKRWRKFGEDLECFTDYDPQILEVLEKVRGGKDG